MVAVLLSSCTGGQGGGRQSPIAPSPSSREVEIRVGLFVGAAATSVSGAGPIAVTDSLGSGVITIPAGETWQVKAGAGGLSLSSPSGWISAPRSALSMKANSVMAPLRVNGKAYRGAIEVLRDRTGLTVVNRLGMELYLLGVVSAEMGRRNSSEQAALRAQAVVSRTYAFRNLRRWRSQGFDLYATVSDQAYGGLGAETPEGRDAVRATAGRVLTYRGNVIEAFYYSTCGGRTAYGFEVFRGASRPYLRSGSDLSPRGEAYCSISPRYRWREEWTGERLRAVLGRHLPGGNGRAKGRIDRVADIRITQRSGSGRVDQLAVSTEGQEVRVEGQAKIRQVLRTATDDVLRSTAFTLVATGGGQNVTHLVANGMGAGHGVGLCQWGAVGRSRAGENLEQILSAYYPGTTLERRY